jgi:Flp pilus assembly protein CpaB
MEMEYRDPSRRGKVIVVLGIVMGILAGAAALYVVQRAQLEAGAAGVEHVPIVVAARDIAARTPIEAADLLVREVPMDDSNASGTFSDPTAVTGLVTSVPILTGQPVLANMLAGASGGGTIGILGPNETIAPDSPAWRAVAVTVPDERAAGGLIEAGQTVDMIATVLITLPERLVEAGRYTTDRSSKLIYQDMMVLAKTTTAYVIKAPIEIAEEISHFQASGAASFTLLIRPSQDLRLIDAGALGTTTSDIIRRYGLRIPEVFPPGAGPLPRPSTAPSTEPSPTATPSADESASPAP